MYLDGLTILALVVWIIYLLWRVKQLSKMANAEMHCLARAINIILSDFNKEIRLEHKNKRMTRRELSARIARFVIFLNDYVSGSLKSTDKLSEAQIFAIAFPGMITCREGVLSEAHRNKLLHELRFVVTHELGLIDYRIEDETDEIINNLQQEEIRLSNHAY